MKTNYSGLEKLNIDSADVPEPASFVDRIGISVGRIHLIAGLIEGLADKLHGPRPVNLSNQANSLMAGVPAESVTKKIIDLAEAVDALERAVIRAGEGL